MKIRIFTLTIALLLSHTSLAGQEKGGGLAILQNGHYKLYDFVENGIEDTAALAPREYSDRFNILPRLQANLENDHQTIQAVKDKFYQVFDKSHHFGYVLYLDALSLYEIRFVNSDLIESRDLGSSPLRPAPNVKLIQVAVRDDRMKIIWINRSAWRSMELSHKVGLIMHEMIYALLVKHTQAQDSYRTRILNAKIHLPAFDSEQTEAFRQKISEFSYFDFPHKRQSGIYRNEVFVRADYFNNFQKLKDEVLELQKTFSKYTQKITSSYTHQTESLKSENCDRTALWPIINYQGYNLYPLLYYLNEKFEEFYICRYGWRESKYELHDWRPLSKTDFQTLQTLWRSKGPLFEDVTTMFDFEKEPSLSWLNTFYTDKRRN